MWFMFNCQSDPVGNNSIIKKKKKGKCDSHLVSQKIQLDLTLLSLSLSRGKGEGEGRRRMRKQAIMEVFDGTFGQVCH